MDLQEFSTEVGGWEVVLPSFGRQDEGSWYQLDQDTCLQAAEYIGAVHHFIPRSRPIPGG